MISNAERLGLNYLKVRGFRSRHLSTRAGKLHVIEGEGRGHLPPVVLLHGLSANGISFHDLMLRLRPHASRVIAPDLPGHGFSDTPSEGLDTDAMNQALFDVLDRVIDEPAVVVGTSMGGMAAARYSARRSNKVAGLVLVSPGGAPMFGEELDRFLDTFRIDDHAGALEFVDKVFARPPRLLRPWLARGVKQKFSNRNLRRLINEVRGEDLLSPTELAALEMPVLMLWGREEKILPESVYDFYRSHLPEHAQIERWSNFGHIGFLEQSAALTRRLLAFAEAAQREPARGVLRITPSDVTLAASA